MNELAEFIQPDLLDLNESDIPCPKCLEHGRDINLYIYPMGTSPDDYETGLICIVCHYFERE